MSKFDEQIIVVNRDILFNKDKNAFNGFLHKNNFKGKEIFSALSKYEVKRRGDMEDDPSFKQLISYCLLENEKGEILVYERLSGGGEERLHGQSSIGVGGHMNDVTGADSINEVLRVNAQRELEEEVGLSNNDVGKVHMGVVFKITVQSNDVEAKETDTLKIKWIEQGDIHSYEDFETWSALILQDIS